MYKLWLEAKHLVSIFITYFLDITVDSVCGALEDIGFEPEQWQHLCKYCILNNCQFLHWSLGIMLQVS